MCTNRTTTAYTLSVDCIGPFRLLVSPDLIEHLQVDAIRVTAYIPGGFITPERPSDYSRNRTLPLISLHTGDKWNVRQQSDLLEIQIPSACEIPVGVWMAVYAWLCPRWIASSVLPFHAVALEHKDQAVLLAGPSGVGKSTLAIRCMTHSSRFLTGNKSLISLNTFSVVGGTYAVTVRADHEKDLSSLGHRPVTYSDRAAVLLDPPQAAVPVAGIVLPTLLSDEYASSGWSHKIQYPSSLHRLLPIATDVNNSIIALGDGEAHVAGQPEHASMASATRGLAEALQRVPVHLIGGSIAFGVAELEALMEEWS